MIKAVVFERAATLPSYAPASHDTPAQREKKRARVRAKAEAEVLRHFLRLRAQGLVSLRQMRRRRLSVGAPVPPVVAETLCGVVVLAAALSYHHAAELALSAG